MRPYAASVRVLKLLVYLRLLDTRAAAASATLAEPTAAADCPGAKAAAEGGGGGGALEGWPTCSAPGSLM
jgi:hypothetical protein